MIFFAGLGLNTCINIMKILGMKRYCCYFCGVIYIYIYYIFMYIYMYVCVCIYNWFGFMAHQPLMPNPLLQI